MTVQTIRGLIDRHAAAAAGLAALGAALDAIGTGTPMDPTIEARIADLLAALGGADALAGVTPAEASSFVAELRHTLALDAKLLWGRSRTPGWTHSESEILQAIGEFSRNHATMLSRGVVPNLAGLAARFAAPGAKFLDVGIGVAGTAIAVAELWPAVNVVGIDVLGPALALARENVARSTVRDRIEVREQGMEQLTEEAVYDFAWVPMPFIPAHAIEAGCPRIRRALKPGGWTLHVFINPANLEGANAAMWKLRQTMWGGPAVTPSSVETMLRDNGFVEIVNLPTPPHLPVGLVAGRRGD